MKAIINNNDTFEVTGERGDFWITKNNAGKVKLFVKKNVEIVDINAMPPLKFVNKSNKAAKLKVKLQITSGGKSFSESFSSLAEKEAWLEKREIAKWGSVSW